MGGGTEAIDCGITGVWTYKSGDVVQVIINKSVSVESGGWLTLGTLPEGLRPKFRVIVPGADNNNNTYATANIIVFDVNTTGIIRIYVFSDKKSFQFVGNVTYLV